MTQRIQSDNMGCLWMYRARVEHDFILKCVRVRVCVGIKPHEDPAERHPISEYSLALSDQNLHHGTSMGPQLKIDAYETDS
jgi:hypothetical protein